MDQQQIPTKIQEMAYECKVEEAMTRDVICVKPDDDMHKVRKILRDQRISGIPVVEDKKITGIISTENFITCLLRGGINEKIRQNMTTDISSIYSDEPLVHAITKFDRLGYGRFPVVDRETGNLVGIVTKGDIMRCLFKKLEIAYHTKEQQEYRAHQIFVEMESDKAVLTLKHKIIGGDFKVAGEKSGRLKKNLKTLGIKPEYARRVVIAACEAEMNIIIFTQGGELVARIDSEKIKVNAIDKGPGIEDIEKAMQPGYSTAPDWVREMGFGAGMGLPNIKNCTDKMKIKSQPGIGTNLEFTVFLN